MRQELEQLRTRLKQREQSLSELQQYHVPRLQQKAADAVREASLAYAEAALELGRYCSPHAGTKLGAAR